MGSLPLPSTSKVSKMQGKEQTPSESCQQAQESGPQGYGLHFADVQSEAQGGQVRPRGHRMDVLPTPSCYPNEMLVLHPVPHLIYSAECAWEGHADASRDPGHRNNPSVQPPASGDTVPRLTPNMEGRRALWVKRNTTKSD